MKSFKRLHVTIKLMMISLAFSSLHATKRVIPEYTEWKKVPPPHEIQHAIEQKKLEDKNAEFEKMFPRDKIIYAPKESEKKDEAPKRPVSTNEVTALDPISSIPYGRNSIHQQNQSETRNDERGSIYSSPRYSRDSIDSLDEYIPYQHPERFVFTSPENKKVDLKSNDEAAKKPRLSTGDKVGLGLGIAGAGTALAGAGVIATIGAAASAAQETTDTSAQAPGQSSDIEVEEEQ